MNLKVSVIIPAYNAENDIEHCIESIISQTYKNTEIIIVNDGSKDNTKKILEKLNNKYKNIIIINQKNNGVSASRNAGINMASGDYLMFVDSDDFLENIAIEHLLKNKENDLVLANYKKYYNEDKIINNFPIKEKKYQKKEFLKNFWNLYNNFLINSPWNKLYKKSIIKSNNIRFNSKYELGEDLIFNLEYLTYCKSVYVTSEYLYNYKYSDNSLATKYRSNYLEIQLELIKFMRKFFEQNNEMNKTNKYELDKLTCNAIICSIQNLFLQSANLSNKEIKKILNEYVNLKIIETFNDVVYDEKRLKIMQKLILKKRINVIILYSRFKEKLKNILGR